MSSGFSIPVEPIHIDPGRRRCWSRDESSGALSTSWNKARHLVDKGYRRVSSTSNGADLPVMAAEKWSGSKDHF